MLIVAQQDAACAQEKLRLYKLQAGSLDAQEIARAVEAQRGKAEGLRLRGRYSSWPQDEI